MGSKAFLGVCKESRARLFPFLASHPLCISGHVAVIILISVTLAGCSSYSAMTNVYLFGLAYASASDSAKSAGNVLWKTLEDLKGSSQLEVRAGYFGMCVRHRGIIWLCSSDAAGLAQQIEPHNDPLGQIGVAAKFREHVVFAGVMITAVVLAVMSMTLLLTFPGWIKELDSRNGELVDVRPFPSERVSRATLLGAFVAAVLLLIAGLWQHIGSVGAAAMAETATYGNVRTDIGVGAMTMAWLAFTLEATVTMGLLMTILSVVLLDRFTVND
ncbi:hypothetical protein CC86DRAFT_446614 [Ophiobolus disseminans]|uniref:Membrane fusion mating protein FIG1 n=1 Tax=Ophiobolus disseminans TaxID=1469910 RepID=A0A6A6ZXS0_9PLEO|nr:hypothetical protein CC86DRAFT_446614 [Ophiobolus disseminans]